MQPPSDPEYLPEDLEPHPTAPRAIRGRGTGYNPPNRFEPISIEPDPSGFDPDEEDLLPRTQVFRDAGRSLITTNDSPDIGFEASLNPYRGCEHGCVYCLEEVTPILLPDGSQRPIGDLAIGQEIVGTIRRGHYRRYTKTRVLARWTTKKPVFRIVLEDGTELRASGDHRFLTERGWKFVSGAGAGPLQRPHLTMNNKLMGPGKVGLPDLPRPGIEYRRGYLCGMIRGDGHLASYRYPREGRTNGDQHQYRLALTDSEALERSRQYLADLDVPTLEFRFNAGKATRGLMPAIRTNRRDSVRRIRNLIAWPDESSAEWARGFLAGIFDAEGSGSHGILRIMNTDHRILDQVRRELDRFGFRTTMECRANPDRKFVYCLRVLGGLNARLRFFRIAQPAISRKLVLEAEAVKSNSPLKVMVIEPTAKTRMLVDITTGTGDFLANGVVSHNCYARPTHEYLGLGSGLDFETKIFAKTEAPELLRRELTSPRWTPKVLAMSGVTDPYQPLERRLGITRGCLEVLAEFRNPVAVITKNHLVTRDLDLLAELARHGAVSVHLSITSLDDDLRRVLEPRTSPPSRRLAAIRALSGAGIPVGVMVAPVIPGLTEPEIPAILAAAREAGAVRAGYTVLRLPYQVGPLFETWLEAHRPLAKDRILARVRALRGGRLNDPRFGTRMHGEGFHARELEALFRLTRRRTGYSAGSIPLSTGAFRRPPGPQGELFTG